tara:strand:- start:12565 stop:12888 length:324 start_codon:yes stop_codon:yes gene_type:complete
MINEKDWIESTNQNNEDPTEFNGVNPSCEICEKEIEMYSDYCEDHQDCIMCGENNECECEDEWSGVSSCCEARMDTDQGLCYSCKDHCESVWDEAIDSNRMKRNTLK